MKCPFCTYFESKVIDSRPMDDNQKIRRRRECLKCGKRFTTYEIVETMPIMVIKRDNSREPYERQKLINGFMRACEKRPVSIEKIEEMVDHVEARIQGSMEREISSKRVGEYALEELKSVDEVAYIRFASVYRQFKDVSTFLEELNKLMSEK
ncbi:MAG: transcriptional regulator NrdR [Acutalibacteraceae bacterium]